jgi:capsular polysaccharide biosynthesis protein
MNTLLEWMSDPSRVFNTVSVFLAGVVVGMLLVELT